MNRKINKIIKFIIIILIYAFLTYIPNVHFIIAPLSSLLIILIASTLWKDNWVERIGFKLTKQQISLSQILFIATILLSYFTIDLISWHNDITYYPLFKIFHIHTIGQTLNEEIILGAFILLSLKLKINEKYTHASMIQGTSNLTKKLLYDNDIVIPVAIAFIFSMAHHIFYAYITIDQGQLSSIALINLFTVGFIRNYLIYKSGHIGYSWAIHCGFNIMFFSQSIKFDGTAFKEHDQFNIYIGSIPFLILTTTVIILMLFLYNSFYIKQFFLKQSWSDHL